MPKSKFIIALGLLAFVFVSSTASAERQATATIKAKMKVLQPIAIDGTPTPLDFGNVVAGDPAGLAAQKSEVNVKGEPDTSIIVSFPLSEVDLVGPNNKKITINNFSAEGETTKLNATGKANIKVGAKTKAAIPGDHPRGVYQADLSMDVKYGAF